MDHIILEIGLALGLIAFAVALANKLGLSNIPFLILIGIAVGPHAPQWGVFDFRFIRNCQRFHQEFNGLRIAVPEQLSFQGRAHDSEYFVR